MLSAPAQGEERLGWIRQFPKLPWREDRAAFDRLVAMAKYDWGSAWTDEAWSVLGGELDRLAALAAEHRFTVAIVAFPFVARGAAQTVRMPKAYAASTGLDPAGHVYQNDNDDDDDENDNRNGNNDNDDESDNEGEDNDNDDVECFANLNSNEEVPCDFDGNGNDNGNGHGGRDSGESLNRPTNTTRDGNR